MLQSNVGGRKAEASPELLAVRDMPRYRVGPAEHFRRALEIALGERFADRRARDPLRAQSHRRHRFDTEAAARRAKERQVSGPPSAEAEILADQYPARTQRAHQDPVDEFGRGEARQPGVEARDVHARHTER